VHQPEHASSKHSGRGRDGLAPLLIGDAAANDGIPHTVSRCKYYDSREVARERFEVQGVTGD
jgi:hypothetical protein